MKKKLLLLLIPVLALASCSRTEEPIKANDESEKQSKIFYKKDYEKTIEINEKFSIRAVEFPEGVSCGGGYYHYGIYNGTCNFTNLGKVNIFGGGCRKNLNYNETNSWDHNNWYGEVYESGQNTTFVMPNGDKIFLSNDVFDVYFTDTEYLVGSTTFNLYITGGTGKYTNAQGTLTCKALIKIYEEEHIYELSGLLKY